MERHFIEIYTLFVELHGQILFLQREDAHRPLRTTSEDITK